MTYYRINYSYLKFKFKLISKGLTSNYFIKYYINVIAEIMHVIYCP